MLQTRPNLTSSTSPAVVGVMVFLLILAPLLAMVVANVPPYMSLGLVLGIVVFIGSFASTQIALYVLIFATLLSPEFGSRTTSGSGVTLRLDDFLLLIIGFSQLTKAAVNRDIGLFSWTPLNRWITYYMLVCIFATGLGMVSGRVRPLTGFFFVLKYFEYFIVYFLMVNNLDSAAQAKRFLMAMLATAAIVSVVAIAQIPTGGRVVAPFEGESGEPNTLGGYLILIEAVIGGLLLTRNAVSKRWHRIGLVGLLGLLFIPLLFTLSRASWLAAVPVFLLFLVLAEKKLILSLITISAIIIAPVIMPDAVRERLFYTVETQESKWARAQQEQIAGITFDTSSSARIRSWRYALNDFTKKPILGFGVTGWKFIDAQYLRILLETGLAGLITFTLLIGTVMRIAWRTYKSDADPFLRGVALGFFIGTVGMLVHATMANTFIIVRIMEPYWILAAIVVTTSSLTKPDDDTAETQPETEGEPATPPRSYALQG